MRVRIARRARWLILAVTVVAGVGLSGCVVAARADETVYACGTFPNDVFYESDAFGMEEQDCGSATPDMAIHTSSTSTQGADSYWAVDAPSGLAIDEATIGALSVNGVNGGATYGGGFFWGPSATNGATVVTSQAAAGPFGVAQGDAGFPSTDFGFQMICGASSCGNDGAFVEVGDVALSVGETEGPSITAGGVWGQSGWVRGSWPVSVAGDSPSGICSLSASISGDPATVSGSMSPNQLVWHQCDGSVAGTLNTAQAPNGSDTLTVSDTDAAGLSASSTKTINVDNVTPTVSLTGPATALSTAGTRDVTVSVGAGPSGAYGADCSVDGGASAFYAGATSQVPVSGIGEHTVTCTGLNNAMSSSGQRASSAPESFGVDIQQPTEEAITFSKLADPLKCRTIVERLKKLGRPRTIKLHGHRVQVRRYRYVKRRVRKCKARTVRRRVLVPLKRHGKVVRRHGKIVRVTRTERVVVLPHHVHKTVRHVKHGHRTTVSGVLLQADGTPLAGQTITVLAAPNDADLQFAPMSTATTNADGYWIAKIPPGPSRLIEAQYGGSATTAAASSTTVKLMVPARLRILSRTARVAWGRTATFTGRVYGGFIPRAGVNLRLRYGYGKDWITYGVKTHVRADGRFRTTFTFGPGDPRHLYHFRFQFSTLPGGDYPWAHAASNIVGVVVGGHPHPAAHKRHRHRTKRRRRHRKHHHR